MNDNEQMFHRGLSEVQLYREIQAKDKRIKELEEIIEQKNEFISELVDQVEE